MITVIDGLTGSAKTFFLTHKILFKEWKKGELIAANYKTKFNNFAKPDKLYKKIIRWRRLDEIFGLTKCIIAIDDAQILMDARRWQSLPSSFTEKVSAHRHHHIDLYTTTQDWLHLDARVRQNVHLRYSCRSLFRFPRKENKKPILQICKIIKKYRKTDKEETRIKWVKEKRLFYLPRLLFISKLWTKDLYDTYSDLDLDRFLCKIIVQRKPGERKSHWKIKMFSRHLVNSGKARI